MQGIPSQQPLTPTHVPTDLSNPLDKSSVTIRPADPGDAPVIGAICYEAFKFISNQHNFPADFPNADMAMGLMSSLLARKDVYSVVAEENGRVAGSNFLWENGVIAGIGPITIAPNYQNGRIGRMLMEDVLARAKRRGFAGLRLVQAAYHNRSLALYARLGFDVREPLANLQGPALHFHIPGYSVRKAAFEDLDDCERLCTRIHGHGRSEELVDAIKQATATVVEFEGRLVGYATLIGYFGHAVAENNEALKALIGAAEEFPGPGFLLPSRNGDLFRWCLNHGLRVVQPMSLMSLGLYNPPSGAFLPSILY